MSLARCSGIPENTGPVPLMAGFFHCVSIRRDIRSRLRIRFPSRSKTVGVSADLKYATHRRKYTFKASIRFPMVRLLLRLVSTRALSLNLSIVLGATRLRASLSAPNENSRKLQKPPPPWAVYRGFRGVGLELGPVSTPEIGGGCHFHPSDGASRRVAWTATLKNLASMPSIVSCQGASALSSVPHQPA